MLAAAEYRLGHHEVARQHSQELLQILGEKCFRLPPEECEVLYGRAGAMQAILFLRKECQDQSLGTDLMVRLAKEILLQGRHEARVINHSMSLLWQWHGKHYLGAAHGVVGILHTLLQLTHDDWTLIEHQLAAENDPMLHPLQTMQRTLKTLTDNFCMPSGNLQSSMSSEKDRLVHWCHGATGLCLLLIRAAKVFPNGVSKNYMQLAADIAEAVLWPRGLLRKGVGLCHGISGNAYVFLQLAEALKEGDQTSSTKWKERALLYACFAVDHLNELRDTPDRPLSLYQGLGGLVCFLVDCFIFTLQPSMFPLYDYF
jgi:lantibiotic modifying enzyme